MSPTISFIQGDDIAIAVAVTQTGKSSRTASSAILVGSGTNWNVTMIGATLTFADGFTTTIAAVSSATSLTMAANATKTDSSPVSYTNTVDITGWTIWFTVKDTLEATNDSTALIEVNVTTHTNPLQGLSSIPLPRTVTNVTSGTDFYDVRMTDSNDRVMSIHYGQCIIFPAIGQRVS